MVVLGLVCWIGEEKVKVFDEKGWEKRKLGFWWNLGRVSLLLEVNGEKFVWRLYIEGQIVSRLAQNVSRFSVCNGRKFLKPPKSCHVWAKRVTIHLFMKSSCPEIVSRFGQRVTIWLGRMDINFNLEKFWDASEGGKIVSRFAQNVSRFCPVLDLKIFSSDCFS